MINKINKLSNWQAAFIIAVLGLAVFWTGLTNPFQGDDLGQIVNSIPAHSINNVKLFFEGSTFYNGQGLAPLSGTYYRPLMVTFYALIYSVFGNHPFFFHLFQLLLAIGSTIILYLFFKFSFKPVLALFLSLIFLIHPIDSQVVFSIPNLQDALFFFFGILSLYILVYTKSIKGLLCSAVLLMLSLFSKETAITFVVITLLYLAWWDRKRAYWFAAIMAPITGLYLILKIHAIGFASASTIAPIDRVNFAGRLLNAPSIVLFYIGKFMFPWKLATEYYWVYSAFSVKHFVEPLLIDLIAASIVIYLAVRIHNESSKAIFYTFIFFAVWLMMGLLLTLQIVPLDMTVAESWFYFPMVGLLGMIGIVLMEIPIRMRPNWMLLVVGVLLISILGFRSAIRGEDWRSETKLAYANIAASPSDYSADNLITYSLINQGNYSRAKNYAQYSVHLFPTYDNYNNLGLAYAGLGNYPMALTAYKNGLSYGNYNAIFENVGELSLVYGTPSRDKIFLKGALAMYPEDPILLTDLAIFEDAHNDNKDARVAIFHAREYGFVSNYLYDGIMNDQAIRLNLPDVGKSLYIHGFN